MAEDDSTKIFTSIKVALGLQPDYTPFDEEILLHINSVISNLAQLGVGSPDGMSITVETTWSELLTDSKLENVKSYVFMRVKMLFDSSTMPQHLVSAYQRMIEEQEWRITVASDPMIPQLVPDLDGE